MLKVKLFSGKNKELSLNNIVAKQLDDSKYELFAKNNDTNELESVYYIAISGADGYYPIRLEDRMKCSVFCIYFNRYSSINELIDRLNKCNTEYDSVRIKDYEIVFSEKKLRKDQNPFSIEEIDENEED